MDIAWAPEAARSNSGALGWRVESRLCTYRVESPGEKPGESVLTCRNSQWLTGFASYLSSSDWA
jgi:hypothetical protein